MAVAENDPDTVVQRQAIKAIGAFGTNASGVEARIEAIASLDSDKNTRSTAAKALQEIQQKSNRSKADL